MDYYTKNQILVVLFLIVPRETWLNSRRELEGLSVTGGNGTPEVHPPMFSLYRKNKWGLGGKEKELLL